LKSALGGGMALRRADLDLAAPKVRVERVHVEIRSRGLVEGRTKSRAGVRTVALPPALVPLLRRHLSEFVGQEPMALLFTGPTGTPLPGCGGHR
ncbi:MAG: site-specific integrase, partial [Actinomycetota bacterium]|nr:site-specific integrase [Actinomycetota bacterium]